MNMQSSPQDSRIDFDTKAMQRHRKVRHFKDHFTRWYVAVGGLGVSAAILLIFLYLLSEVLPLFSGADLEERTRYQPAWAANSGAPLMLAMEEQAEVGVRLAESGQLAFFQTADGALISEQQLPIPDGAQITSFNVESPTSRQFVVGLSNGQVIIGRHDYRVTYPEDRRLITPSLVFPYGSEPLTLDEQGRALDSVTMRVNGGTMALIGSGGRNLVCTRISSREKLM